MKLAVGIFIFCFSIIRLIESFVYSNDEGDVKFYKSIAFVSLSFLFLIFLMFKGVQ